MRLTLYLLGTLSVVRASYTNFFEVQPAKYDKKLVLDLDDTLYPRSNPLRDSLIGNINRFVGHVLHIEDMEMAAQISNSYHRDYGTSVTGLHKMHGVNTDDYEEYLNSHIDYSTIGTDNRLITMLSAAKADIVIFTNSGRVHTERTLDILGIRNLLHMVVFVDYKEDNFPAKPNARAFERVEAVLGTKTGISFVDDGKMNVVAASARGWTSVHVNEGPADAVVPEERDGDESVASIQNIYDLPRALPELF